MASKLILDTKKQEVAEIRAKIAKAKSVVIVDYRGLTVLQDTQIRNEMRKAGVEYKVLKNRLVFKALEQEGYKGLDKALEGPSAIAFSYDDPVASSKIIAEAIRTTKKMAFKGGIVEGKVLDAQGMAAVATIPAKEVLIAQLLGMLTSPMRSLAVVIDQIAQQKQANN